MKKNIFFSFLFSTLLSSVVFSQAFITTKGKNIIGVDGKPLQLKGTNLGNWLVPEGYMFLFKEVSSPRLIHQTLTELVGPEEMKIFWKKYLDSYITEADIQYLKRIGMNSIRIPFNYRLFTNENYMGSNDSTRGFKYLDRVINWCKKEKLYVLLDMRHHHCGRWKRPAEWVLHHPPHSSQGQRDVQYNATTVL